MSISVTPTSKEEFLDLWRSLGERDDEPTVGTAWQRYQQVNSPDYIREDEADDFTLDQIRDFYTAILDHPEIKPLYEQVTFLSLEASTIPWTPTGIDVNSDRLMTVMTSGRTWRSRLLDLYLRPQFNLWFRIGVNGPIFNSTRDTKSFVGEGSELYLANQFPGSFHDRAGGRVGGNLSAYAKADGVFHVVIVQWKTEGPKLINLPDTYRKLLDIGRMMFAVTPGDRRSPLILVERGIERMSSDYYIHRFPLGWKLLWFLGESEIFSREQSSAGESESEESEAMIRCVPYGNVGILQKEIANPVKLQPGTAISWSWNVTALPSRLREDTTMSHDYFSIAVEFENGRDLTYTWSWELPTEFGYWCPLTAWCDREYHVVIRSGTEQLGQWLDEERDIHGDYVKYINAGDISKPVPIEIVRIWLIAGNRWQRHHGEMLIKKIKVQNARDLALEIL